MASKEQQLAIKIAGKIDGSFTSMLSTVQSGISSIAKAASTSMLAAGAAVAGIGAASVNVGKEFESSMSQVAATMLLDTSSEEGIAQFNALEAAARQCGATTSFSATEAAQALNNLAMAGYGVDQATTALPTVLNLAGAGALSLADSSRYLTAGLASLGLDTTEQNFNHFADVLAITASKAKTDVAGLGDAITTVGATGGKLAGGLDEAAAALGVLANVDYTGAEGGTHLRNIINSLQEARNADAAAMFEKMGVSAYDANGNMRPLQDTLGDIGDYLNTLDTQQAKDNVINTLFKQTDRAAAQALIDNLDKWDELQDAAENASEGIGAAAKMYAIQMDNLAGDTAILGSALADVGIGIYKNIRDPLREMTQYASTMVTKLGDALNKGGLTGLADAFGDVLGESITTAAKNAPAVVQAARDVLTSFGEGIRRNAPAMGQAGAELVSGFLSVAGTYMKEFDGGSRERRGPNRRGAGGGSSPPHCGGCPAGRRCGQGRRVQHRGGAHWPGRWVCLLRRPGRLFRSLAAHRGEAARRLPESYASNEDVQGGPDCYQDGHRRDICSSGCSHRGYRRSRSGVYDALGH